MYTLDTLEDQSRLHQPRGFIYSAGKHGQDLFTFETLPVVPRLNNVLYTRDSTIRFRGRRYAKLSPRFAYEITLRGVHTYEIICIASIRNRWTIDRWDFDEWLRIKSFIIPVCSVARDETGSKIEKYRRFISLQLSSPLEIHSRIEHWIIFYEFD